MVYRINITNRRLRGSSQVDYFTYWLNYRTVFDLKFIYIISIMWFDQTTLKSLVYYVERYLKIYSEKTKFSNISYIKHDEHGKLG